MITKRLNAILLYSSFRRLEMLRVFAVLLTAAVASSVMCRAQATPDSKWKGVEDAMGRPGQVQPGDVLRFAMPRKDLHVMRGDVAIKAGLALGGWAAFVHTEHGAMVMGDLVLTEDEVGPVMRKLQEGGIEISAVHNHLLGESPHVMYMHISSHGDAVKMAHAIHDAVALTKTPGPDAGSAPAATEPLGIDQKAIEETLGRSGKVNGGILQFGVPRVESVTEDGMVVPPSMGVATAINFQPTGAGKAAITGDFVLLGKEVNPVMKALRENGIEVTAVHSHMLMEEPRLFFMHFWANDDAVKLAKGLRAALDSTNSKK
jgi:biotin operon repressor